MPVKGGSRLQFTEAEQDGGRLKEHDRAKEREADRTAARSRATPPPKSRKKLKRRMIEQKNGTGKKKSGKTATGQSAAKGESQLHFEENRPKPPSKLSHTVRDAPGLMVSSQLHRQISEAEDENVGVESAHRLEQTAEGGAYLAAHSHRAHQLRQYRAAERAEVDALYRQSLRDHPELGSNPLSRWQQKQAIKRQYAEARRASQKAEGTFKTASERISDTLRGAAEQGRKAGEFIVRHKRGVLIVLALFFMVVLLLNTMSSCSVLAEALLGAGGGILFHKLVLNTEGIVTLLQLSLIGLLYTAICGSISIPLVFKFGAERARMLMFASFIAPSAIFYGIYKLLVGMGIDLSEDMIPMLLCIAPVVVVIWVAVMFKLSCHIVSKQEL